MNEDKILLQAMMPAMVEEILTEDEAMLKDPVVFATAMFQQISEMEGAVTESLGETLTVEQVLGFVDQAMNNLVEKGVVTKEYREQYLETIRNEGKLNVFRANAKYLNRQVHVPQYQTKCWNRDLERIQSSIARNGNMSVVDEEDMREEFSKEIMKRYMTTGFEMSGLIDYHPNNLYDVAKDMLTATGEDSWNLSATSHHNRNYGGASDVNAVIALAKEFTSILGDIDEEANTATGPDSSFVRMNQRISLLRHINANAENYEVKAAAEELVNRMGFSYENLSSARRRIVRMVFDRILRGQPLYSDLALALDDLKIAFRAHVTALNFGFRSLVELANRQGYEIVIKD